MCENLGLRQPNDVAGRDRHPVQADALRVEPEVGERGVLLAQAEVLARLGRVLADPELQRRLLGAGQSPRDPARPTHQRVELRCEARLQGRGIEDRRDLDPDLAEAGAAARVVAPGHVPRAQKAFAAPFHSSRRRVMRSDRSSTLPPSRTSRSVGSALR